MFVGLWRRQNNGRGKRSLTDSEIQACSPDRSRVAGTYGRSPPTDPRLVVSCELGQCVTLGPIADEILPQLSPEQPPLITLPRVRPGRNAQAGNSPRELLGLRGPSGDPDAGESDPKADERPTLDPRQCGGRDADGLRHLSNAEPFGSP